MSTLTAVPSPTAVARWKFPFIARLFFSRRRGQLGLPLLLLIVACAVFAPYISPHNPLEQDLRNRLRPPFWAAKGTMSHPLGTDQFGRDILSRVFFGARASLAVGLTSVCLSCLLGVPIGLVSGYFRGRLDEIIMALADAQQAFPFVLLALVIAFMLGPSLQNSILALGLTGWITIARVVRAEVLSVRELEYIVAAKAIGCSTPRILFRHILPQVMTPLIVLATLQIGQLIIVESALSFLGMGIQPPTPSWGTMLAEGRDHMLDAWWYAAFPGIAIMLTVFGFNLTGDWLRDMFDPQSRRLQ